jgi:hypothetical protein
MTNGLRFDPLRNPLGSRTLARMRQSREDAPYAPLR